MNEIAATIEAGRPHMPEGYLSEDAELLPWEHARQRLEEAIVYWVGTTRPNGRPHVTPIWGVWVDETLYFDGSPETRRGRNLAANPAVAIHVSRGDDGKDIVILEGEAHQIFGPGRELAEKLVAAYSAKYASESYAPALDTWDQGGLYRVTPRLVLAWTTFHRNATRWRLDGA
jgi:hypothetical protein